MRHRHLLLAVLALSLSAPAALAHHSFVGNYDGAKLVSLRGVITNVRYYNPHIFFDLAVTHRNGTRSRWKVETESIPLSRKRGLTRGSLKAGAKVTVRGWPARNGSRSVGLKSIVLPNGKTVHVRKTAR